MERFENFLHRKLNYAHALLYALRKAHRLYQVDMAARMSVEERTYRSWEKGYTAPSIVPLQQLAESFGRTLLELLQVDPDTGAFPAAEPASQPNNIELFAMDLLGDPDAPPDIRDHVLKIWRKFRGEG